MQLFQCPTCDAQVWFDNDECPNGHALAFDPDMQAMVIGPQCARSSEIGCNWRAERKGLCQACTMTEAIPDLSLPDLRERWAATEAAKRWVLASLGRWNWFGANDPGAPPVFRLLADETRKGAADLIMGHADGVITIDVAEADRATREQRRQELGEPYRTMIGHMRHEIAHYLFVRLAEDERFLGEFRKVFGDERADYGDALEAHYDDPGSADDAHVTSYATSHPHEDWAETVAHLLHLTDLVDSGAAVELCPGGDGYSELDSHRLIMRASDFALRVNHVNRSLDLPDLYPFILGEEARQKLAFAHRALKRS